MRKNSCVIANVCFAVVIAISTSAIRAAEPILSAAGYGKISFGMRLADVEHTLKEKVGSPEIYEDESCRYVKFKAYPHASFMVENGIVTRVDATVSGRNVYGIVEGDQLTPIRKKYPFASIQPNFYDPDDHYIIFNSPDNKAAVLMDESKGKIVGVRAGLRPSVGYVEGCS